MADADVLILGAGPAGTAAAILCAQRGLRVRLLEQRVFPRQRPGETLHPGVEVLLQQLGVSDVINQAGFVRHTGHWVRWAGERTFSTFGEDAAGPWRGYQIPRAVLDNLLLQRAIACGVEVTQPCRVFDVIRDPLRVHGVQTNYGDFTALHTIDASGDRSWLSSKLGLRWHRFSPPLIVHYGYGAADCPEDDLQCGIEADPFGWYWTANIHATLYHWTRLCFTGADKSKAIAPPAFKHLTAIGPVRGADVTWRMCQQAAGDGFFIAGDAAFVLDPTSSHGVLKALMSGMMAAHAVMQVRSAPWHQLSIQQQYHHWMKTWFSRDRLKMSALYRTHPFPPTWLSAC